MPRASKLNVTTAMLFNRRTLMVFLFAGIFVLLMWSALRGTPNDSTPNDSPPKSPSQCSGGCGSTTSSLQAPSAPRTLLPVNDAMHNVREIIKQMLLLEDHLFQTEKQCRMCITKHILTIEALAEEAVTLDERGAVGQEMLTVASRMRELQIEFNAAASSGPEMAHIAQSVREMRRQLMGLQVST